MDTITVIFLLSTLVLISICMFHAVKSRKLWLVITVAFCAVTTPLCFYKVTVLPNSHKGSTVPILGSMTNGLYQVLGTYEDGSGGYLSIVHRRQIQSLIIEKKVVETVPAEPLPILMRTEFPVMSRTNIMDNYLIEVGNDKNSQFVREYDPFRYIKQGP